MSAFIAIGASMLAPLGYWATLAAVNGRRRAGEPPLVRGSLPYLGVAMKFGRDATSYVQRCRQEHGDVFTLFIAGRRMTFMLDPLSVPAVLKAKQLAFHPVTDDILTDAFNLDRVRARVDVDALEALGRKQLRGAPLEALTTAMDERLAELVPTVCDARWRTVPLFHTVWELMFEAGTDALFGTGVATEQLRRDFAAFDHQFPLMAAGLPRRLVSDGEAALDRLGNTPLVGENASSWILDREPHLASLPEPERGAFRVPVLWATHANTIPAAFWALYHLLRHPEGLRAVRQELDKAVPRDAQTLNGETLGRLRVLESAVSESLRLSSGSLTVREALDSFSLETHQGAHSLRRGDRVCIAPFITHRDPEIFESPGEYRYDRFYTPSGRKQFYKRGRRVPLPLMPFGAGVSMCPGRFFAMNEVKLFVARALASWDIELLDQRSPDFDFGRAGLGIYPPAVDVSVRVRRKA